MTFRVAAVLVAVALAAAVWLLVDEWTRPPRPTELVPGDPPEFR